eukprot:gene32252-41802_t
MSDFDAFLEATIAVEPILPSADLPQVKAETIKVKTKNSLMKSGNGSTARDSSKRSSNSTSKKKRSGSSKKKAGKEDKSKSKEAGTIKDLSDDDDNATAEGELVLSTDRDNQLKQKGNYVAIDSSFSQSNESFLDINLRDVRMRELSLSQDTDLQSAADRILAVKNSLKKIASVDPYDATAAQKELEEQDANDDDEQEAITAAEIALMESLPFSYRSYDELVRLNREKSYAGLLQRKLEAYLTDEDFEIVFRKNRDAFYAQPLWKQKAQKKNVKLF